MQLRFGPDEEQTYLDARDELLRRFEEWLSATSQPIDLASDAQQLLDFKWCYLDGDLSWWTVGHLEEILLKLYPRKVAATPDLLALTLPSTAALLTFLHHHELLSAASDRLERLLYYLGEVPDAFAAAMDDPSRFGVAKSLLSNLAQEALDTTDPSALESWLEAFNARGASERDTLSNVGLRRAGRPRLRPVALPPVEELHTFARAAPALQRLHRFAIYAGEGRRLTERGNLRMADARELVDLLGTDDQVDERIGERVFKTRSSAELPGVDLTFRWARAAGFVKVRAKKVSITKAGGRIHLDPLHAILRALNGLVAKLGVLSHWYRDDRYGFGWFAADVDAQVPGWLVDLYDRGSREIEDLADEAWFLLLDVFDLEGTEPSRLQLHRDLVEGGVRRIFACLEDLGLLCVTGVEEVRLDHARTWSRGGEVALTPLGLWAVNQLISPWAEAPVVGELAGLPAGELLERCADLPEDVARAEMEAWIGGRADPANAAYEIVHALREASDAAVGVGFAGLVHLGADAVAAVRSLAADPRLAPHAKVWRVDMLDLAAEEVATTDPGQLTALLDAVLELRGTHALVGWLPLAVGAAPGEDSHEQVTGAVSELWRVRSPAAREVLEAIASAHPERQVAKAARKALFKLRTSGGANA